VNKHIDSHYGTLNYGILLVWRGGAYHGFVTEFPDLTGHGKTIQEATDNIRAEITKKLDEMHESGELIPTPMPYHEW
jgi:predicted RNase H-like HicB family nuclease